MAFGCPGVDVDKWLAANRVRVAPDFFNYWLLARTTRDDPSEEDIRDTVRAVFVKWFDGSIIDPVATWGGTTRSGVADLIEVVKIGKPGQTLGVPTRDVDDVQTREALPLGPLPVLGAAEQGEGPGWVHVLVRFAYRGKRGEMGWPTWRGGGVDTNDGRRCPLEADWILDRAWVAKKEPTPPEKTTGEKVEESIEKGAAKAGRFAWGILAPVAIVAGLVAFVVRGRK